MWKIFLNGNEWRAGGAGGLFLELKWTENGTQQVSNKNVEGNKPKL